MREIKEKINIVLVLSLFFPVLVEVVFAEIPEDGHDVVLSWGVVVGMLSCLDSSPRKEEID